MAAAGSTGVAAGGGGAGAGAGRLRAVLIDLSGTLHVGQSEVPGAVQALRRLRGSPGLKLRFVTNTTKESTKRLLQTVRGIGLDIHDGELFSSLHAARQLVEARRLHPLLLLHPDALEEFAGIGAAQAQGPDAVVLGLAREAFSYERMNEAFRLLMQQPDAPLIAIHRGRFYRAEDGGLALGPGPYAAALEYATGRKAECVGKPEPGFFRLALGSLGVQAGEAVMVGDDAADDVGGAMRCGMQGLLVQTGKYRPGDERGNGVEPTAVVPDFAAAVEWILQRVRGGGRAAEAEAAAEAAREVAEPGDP